MDAEGEEMKNILIIIQERDEIVKKYCEEKGWDFKNLSIEQLLEVRALPEWQNVEREKK